MARWSGGRHECSWRAAGVAVVAALAFGGGGMIVAAVTAEAPRPPQPAAEAGAVLGNVPAGMALDEATSASGGTARRPPAPTLAPAEPTAITIDAIGVRAKVIPLGLQPNGMIEVPPLDQAQLAGWYRLGPTPGELGNSVIVGHVDSAKIGPAVFFKLGALQPGDLIEVSRQDGSVARFRVDRVASYPKSQFPTELVYGDADRAQLRLVTCGGQFDQKRRDYLDNVIVFATLVP